MPGTGEIGNLCNNNTNQIRQNLNTNKHINMIKLTAKVTIHIHGKDSNSKEILVTEVASGGGKKGVPGVREFGT